MTDRQVEALADCPFCGSTKIDPEGWTSLEQYKGTEQWRSGPSCEECGASAETVEKWNTRSRTPSAPDVAISHDDLCALSRCWNDLHVSPHGIGYRVNQWLKSQIAAALSAPETKAGNDTTNSANGGTRRLDGFCSVQDGRKMSTNGYGAEQQSICSDLNAGARGVTAGETAPTPAVDREAVARIILPEPKVTNPDIASPTGIPYIDGLIHQVLDAQQDINFHANCDMNQSLANVAELMDEVERALRLLAPTAPAQEGE